MALVLCTGTEPALIATRRLILQEAGHFVVTAQDERELETACREHAFEVAVIGQTVSPKIKLRICSLIRRHCPSAKVLELYPRYQGRALEDADSWLQVPAGVPEELVARVNELVNSSRSKHANR